MFIWLAATTGGHAMGEILSLDEIKSRFDSEWVLVEDPQLDESLQVQAGWVVFHSKDRDEVYQKAVELHLKHSAFLYTGELPEGTAVVL
jgi:hypothetical protein